MSYAINYQKHIKDYFADKSHKMATVQEIVAALPKRKVKPTTRRMISAALQVMVGKGTVKRLFRGTFAWAWEDVNKADALASTNPVTSAVVRLLREHPHTGIHAKDIYTAVASQVYGSTRQDVMRALAKLHKYELAFKDNMRWALRPEARIIIKPAYASPSPTPHSKGMAFQSVPAHNILRVSGRKLERIPIIPVKPKAEPVVPEFSIPTQSYSIFD